MIAMEEYIFRKMKPEEATQMFSLVLQRVKWMEQQGIRQWNVTGYTEAYPEHYYLDQCWKGRAFGLFEKKSGRLVCGAVLLESDDRWDDAVPALYLHNFVSSVEADGVGALLLRYAEEYARKCEKRYFRLDSAADNGALEKNYESHGFAPVGTCREGAYLGILRQKLLV